MSAVKLPPVPNQAPLPGVASILIPSLKSTDSITKAFSPVPEPAPLKSAEDS